MDTITMHRDDDVAFARITGDSAPRDVAFDSIPEDNEIPAACGCEPGTPVSWDAIASERIR